jgi:hypothetical protein
MYGERSLSCVSCTGQTLADLSQQLTDDQWGSIDVMINCGVGKFAGKRDDIQVRGAIMCHWTGVAGPLSLSDVAQAKPTQ